MLHPKINLFKYQISPTLILKLSGKQLFSADQFVPKNLYSDNNHNISFGWRHLDLDVVDLALLWIK